MAVETNLDGDVLSGNFMIIVEDTRSTKANKVVKHLDWYAEGYCAHKSQLLWTGVPMARASGCDSNNTSCTCQW